MARSYIDPKTGEPRDTGKGGFEKKVEEVKAREEKEAKTDKKE